MISSKLCGNCAICTGNSSGTAVSPCIALSPRERGLDFDISLELLTILYCLLWRKMASGDAVGS